MLNRDILETDDSSLLLPIFKTIIINTQNAKKMRKNIPFSHIQCLLAANKPPY